MRGLSFSVTSVAAAADGDIAVCFEICGSEKDENSEKVRLVLPTDAYVALGICRGECTAELFESAEREALVYKAYRRALCILCYGSCSEQVLLTKLISKGFAREYAAEAVARVRARGFIDNMASLRREAERCAAKLWGETRIRAALKQKGYSREDIDMALFELLDDGLDFDKNLKLLIVRRGFGGDVPPAEHQKQVAALMRYGYSYSQIKAALL